MKIVTLHRAVDGLQHEFLVDQIREVGEEPAGQCMVYLANGMIFQPAESVEETTKLWKEALK